MGVVIIMKNILYKINDVDHMSVSYCMCYYHYAIMITV